MQQEKNEIIALIKSTVKDVTGIEVEDSNVNLLSTELDIMPADFLYIFDVLEEKLGIPTAEILKCYDYTVMQIDRLSEELGVLLKKELNV